MQLMMNGGKLQKRQLTEEELVQLTQELKQRETERAQRRVQMKKKFEERLARLKQEQATREKEFTESNARFEQERIQKEKELEESCVLWHERFALEQEEELKRKEIAVNLAFQNFQELVTYAYSNLNNEELRQQLTCGVEQTLRNVEQPKSIPFRRSAWSKSLKL